MSKIARYQGNVRAFASDAQGMERTVFGGTNQADDLTSQITASFLRGWGIVGASEHPSLEDFNAAMYAMSQFIAYQHQMGIAEWHAQQEYHIGSICTHNGESYQSLQNANIGSQPPSAKWTPVLTSKNGLANLGLENATKAVIHTGKIIADLNAPPKNSTGFAYQDAQNSPGFNATVLTVDSIEGSYDIQIAIGYNPLKFAFRAYSGDANVWLNWVVLGNAAAKNTGTTAGTVAAGDDSRITGAIQRTAMVGAVSQTGGAPTGAIVERGSNSNGEYTKFADGTLICWFTRSAESTANNSSGGTTNLYFSSEVGLTFPATFVGTTPTVTPSASLSSGGTSSWPSVRGRSLTGTSLALISNVQNAAAYLGYTAIGRWF